MIKKTIKLFHGIRGAILIFKTVKSIKNKKYEESLNKLESFQKKNPSTKEIFLLQLLKKQLQFLLHKYDEVIEGYEPLFLNINESKIYNFDGKMYLSFFLYNLVYVSYMLQDNINEANEVKKVVHHIILPNVNYKNVKPYLEKHHPIYTGYILKELFESNNYEKIFSKEKLQSILNNDILDEYFE